jgi:hypothetical protein
LKKSPISIGLAQSTMMKTFLLIASIYLVTTSNGILSCQVTIDGVDRTDEFYIFSVSDDTNNGEKFVDCEGKSKCKNAIIKDCPIVKCSDTEACLSAQIVHFTQFVTCTGLHSCHRTEIQAASTSSFARTVTCQGNVACAMASISGDLQQVSCIGDKACRHTNVEGAKLVKCHRGSETAVACLNLASFQTDCMYCGDYGCSNRINQCRFKSLDATPDDAYSKCLPGTIVGNNCPTNLTGEMKLDSIVEEKKMNVDEGGERARRLLRT